MNYLERRIAEWKTARGLDMVDGTGHLLKLVEETGELAGAHVKEKPFADKCGEAADVLICLVMYAQAQGINLLEEAIKKMSINEGRAGRANRFGVFVKEADL